MYQTDESDQEEQNIQPNNNIAPVTKKGTDVEANCRDVVTDTNERLEEIEDGEKTRSGRISKYHRSTMTLSYELYYINNLHFFKNRVDVMILVYCHTCLETYLT